ncbi:MAG: DUF2304 family protein [Candidatus Woesebacteria bacterium]|jgi:hypothetical protein
MGKYTLLMLLNVPLVIYGMLKAISAYKKGSIKTIGFITRLGFWVTILIGLVFVQEIYEFLIRKNLTDSTPLSIVDVVLVTGISFCLFLILRLYTKVDNQERRFVELHEKVSIELSNIRRVKLSEKSKANSDDGLQTILFAEADET